jgi:hypothetical protein
MTSMGRFGFRRAVLAASLIAAAQTAGATVAASREEATAVRVEGAFAARLARDISGIACRPGGADGQPCLLVNDESAFAQMAVLRDGRLSAGPALPLVGPKPPEPGAAAGSASAIGACPGGPDDFGEFDGEGVAWSPNPSGGGGSYFVTGSHACGRKSAKLRASTHLLARIDVDASGAHAPAVLTWRLGPALAAAAQVGPHYNRRLDEAAQGLDVEGVAASGDRLFFGLRAPSRGGHGFVVGVGAADLFAAGDRPVPTRVAKLALGVGVGIRDMAALPDGRLLLLTGPAQEQDDVPFGVALTEPGDAEEWRVRPLLAPVRPISGDRKAKAEGLAVLAASGDTARVLVLFEDPANGGAQEHSLRLPPR